MRLEPRRWCTPRAGGHGGGVRPAPTAYRPEHEAGPQPTFEELLLGAGDPDGARPALGITEMGTGMLVAARLIISHDWCAGALRAQGHRHLGGVAGHESPTYGFAHYQDGRLVREIQRPRAGADRPDEDG